MRRVLLILLTIGLSAQAAAEPLPRSNPIARVKVLSESERSISIKHSRWGDGAAFRWADAHCAKFGKVAVAVGGSLSGTSTISTWRCE